MTCSGRCSDCRSKGAAVDDVAIRRALDGVTVPHLSPAERREAVRLLRASGRSGRQVAERIGCTPRSVWRILSRLDSP